MVPGHEPGRPAPREHRHDTARLADAISPPDQLWFDCQRGRLEIVGTLADRTAERVPCAVRVDRRNRERRGHQREGLIEEGERVEFVADAAYPCPPTLKSERDIGTDPGGDRSVATTRPAQDRSRVGRSAAEAATRGDRLVDGDRGGAPDRLKRPTHQVAFVDWNAGGGPTPHD